MQLLGTLLGLLAWAGAAQASYQYSVVDCPRLSIRARAERSVRPGQIVSYKVQLKNSLKTPVHHVFIEATLPPWVIYPVPPKREGLGQPRSYAVSPKYLLYDGVDDLGTVIQLKNVSVPARKTVTFMVRAKARDCVPDPATLEFAATTYIFAPGDAQTCFLYATPSNATVKASTKAEACPAGVIFGAPVGAVAMAGAGTGQLIDAPTDTFVQTNNEAQAMLRTEQRAAKAMWMENVAAGGPEELGDPVLQPESTEEVQAANTLTVDYSVDSNGPNGYTPPDPSHAVGLNHIVTMTNTRIAIHDKATGAIIMAAKNINAVYQSGLPSSDPCYYRNDGDPVAAWDNLHQRFVVTSFTTASPYKQCIAVSKTADPTGAWWVYSIPLSTSELYDYPRLAIVNDAYVITYNRFGGSYMGGAILLLESPKMVLGQTPQVFKWLTTSTWPVYGYSILPGGSDNVQGAPPAGSAVPIAAIAGNSLLIMKVTWDYAARTAEIRGASSPWKLPVASFSRLCGGRPCVVQQGTSRRLDGLGDRLLQRLVYNHFGTYDTMVVTHSVSTGVRWYEIRNINTGGIDGAPILFQQGTYPNPSGITRWMATMAMDKFGNIGMGFAESGSALYPSLSITGRSAADTAGVMTYGPTRVVTGGGALTCTCSRFGDYASMQVDPIDGCTFFFYHEYVQTTGWGNWRGRLVKFRFPNCA